jgi:hypothetical protein
MKTSIYIVLIFVFTVGLKAQYLNIEAASDAPSFSEIDYPAYTVKLTNISSDTIWVVGSFENLDVRYTSGDGRSYRRDYKDVRDTSDIYYVNVLLPETKHEIGLLELGNCWDMNKRCDADNYTGDIQCTIYVHYFVRGAWKIDSTRFSFFIRKKTKEEIESCQKYYKLAFEESDIDKFFDKLADIVAKHPVLINRTEPAADLLYSRVTLSKRSRNESLRSRKMWLKFVKKFGSRAYYLTAREYTAWYHKVYRDAIKSFD